MVNSKYFTDANITNILNIRKFFAIFLKKNSPSPPHSLIFAIKARGQTSQQVNKPTSQRVEVRQVRRVRQVRQEMGLMGPKGLPGLPGSKTKHPHPHHPPKTR